MIESGQKITFPLGKRQTSALLAELGFRPSKHLGQNFLIEKPLVEKSLELAQLPPAATVLEIGPGLGTLTGTLLAAGHTVFAVEKDPRLAEFLLSLFQESSGISFHLQLEDAVSSPRGLLPDNQEHSILSNLPYSITSPWLEAYLHHSGKKACRMVLLVQKEAADRLRSDHRKGQPGVLSLLLQSAYEQVALHPVAGTCFFPPPAVESCFIVLSLRKEPYFFSLEGRKILRYVFTQRRKVVLSTMRRCCTNERIPAVLETLLKTYQLSLQIRAEAIPLQLWQDWDRTLRSFPQA